MPDPEGVARARAQAILEIVRLDEEAGPYLEHVSRPEREVRHTNSGWKIDLNFVFRLEDGRVCSTRRQDVGRPNRSC